MAKALTLLEFILKSKSKHGDKYDYSLVKYESISKKVSIICPIHGVFEQKPYEHYTGNIGCYECSKKKLNTENFILKSKSKHGDKYDYSLVEYSKNNVSEVKIICKEHGVFNQKPLLHLRGSGCPICYGNPKKTTEKFIEESKKVHGDKYDYSLIDYKNKLKKVSIICPIHGAFQQRPDLHLNGFGCKICNESRLEKKVRNFFIENNIKFISQKKFKDCRNVLPLSFDFFVPEKNLLIECNGIQHYEPVEFFGGKKRYEYQKKNDNIKKEFCEKNNIKLITISSEGDFFNFIISLFDHKSLYLSF